MTPLQPASSSFFNMVTILAALEAKVSPADDGRM